MIVKETPSAPRSASRRTAHRMWLLHTAAVLVLFGLAPAAARADITYYVNPAWVGPIGEIGGSVTTDGTLGVLSAANIVDWTFIFWDGSGMGQLYGPLSGNNSSVYIAGSDVTAAPTQIFFNFDGTDGGLMLFQANLFSDSDFYCFATVSSFPCAQGKSLVTTSVFSPGAMFEADAGNQVVFDSINFDAAPEPGYYAILPASLMALLVASRRRLSRLVR
jgi:hypothetical protein